MTTCFTIIFILCVAFLGMAAAFLRVWFALEGTRTARNNWELEAHYWRARAGTP